MDKDIKAYLHLYIGCRVMNDYNQKEGVLTGVIDGGKGVEVQHQTKWEVSFFEVKPILRFLTSMTEEEEAEYEAIGKPDQLKYRLCMRQEAERTRYLLSKGFDLFGLIESGLAIDSATLQPQNQ